MTAKIVIELDVEAAQELAFTARTTIKKIDWVLENRPPKKSEADKMDARAKLLAQTATHIENELHARAKEDTNVRSISYRDKPKILKQ